jgi:hypothetical protein
MATFQQVPGELNIELAVGDDLSLPLQFSISLTGYTFSADIGGQTPTIDSSQAASGLITLALTDTQCSAINKREADWWFKWTTAGLTRTVLIGTLTMIGKMP